MGKLQISMRKAFVLSSCSTCQRILKEVEWNGVVQNIKEQNIDEATVDKLAEAAGSYEALFSKRAMKYRSLGLNNATLSEQDYKDWILKEYTFLKRPVFIVDDAQFVGNSKKVVAQLKEKLAG